MAWIRDQLRRHIRTGAGRCPYPVTLIVDSQSVKGASTVGAASRGYDAAKRINGRKRHIAVDTLGLPVMITVTAADMTDRDAARELLWHLRLTHPQITQVWADSAYAGQLVTWADERLRLTLRTVSRPRGTTGVRRPTPPLARRAHHRLAHERAPQRPRLRTPAPARRSTSHLGPHHPHDPPPHPQRLTAELGEEAMTAPAYPFSRGSSTHRPAATAIKRGAGG